jgi:hypothetical protein
MEFSSVRYGSPIMDIKWHESVSTASKNLITSDSHIVRIWNPQTVSDILLYLYNFIELFLLSCCSYSGKVSITVILINNSVPDCCARPATIGH